MLAGCKEVVKCLGTKGLSAQCLVNVPQAARMALVDEGAQCYSLGASNLSQKKVKMERTDNYFCFPLDFVGKIYMF